MPAVRRRTFLERLGLGAGAAVLSPLAGSLVSEARGAPIARKRFVVLSYPNGGYYAKVQPPEFKMNLREGETEPFAEGAFTLPDVLSPLEPFKNKTLLVDGLVNRSSRGHFGWTLLTGMPTNGGEGYGHTHKSLDQHVAPVIGRGALFPSVHLGSTTGGDGRPGVGSKLGTHMYAKGPGQPVPVQLVPGEAWKTLFPLGAPAPGGGAPAAPRTDLLQRRNLLDWLSDDVKRLRARLSAAERGKLDEYLGALEEAQRRVTVLEQGGGAAAGCAGGMTFLDPKTAEPDEIFDAQLELGTAALVCGLTNVLTVSFIGIGTAFKKSLGLSISLHGIGHGGGQPDAYMKWFATRAAKLAGRLAAIREGDRTLLDNSVILFANDNNDSHHSRGWRYPLALIGSGGGGLKANGRYVRYPALRRETAAPGGPSGWRPIGDLLSTLSHVFDAPVDDWGKGGIDPVKGPLAELLA
jgi:hypothetical protein